MKLCDLKFNPFLINYWMIFGSNIHDSQRMSPTNSAVAGPKDRPKMFEGLLKKHLPLSPHEQLELSPGLLIVLEQINNNNINKDVSE